MRRMIFSAMRSFTALLVLSIVAFQPMKGFAFTGNPTPEQIEELKRKAREDEERRQREAAQRQEFLKTQCKRSGQQECSSEDRRDLRPGSRCTKYTYICPHGASVDKTPLEDVANFLGLTESRGGCQQTAPHAIRCTRSSYWESNTGKSGDNNRVVMTLQCGMFTQGIGGSQKPRWDGNAGTAVCKVGP